MKKYILSIISILVLTCVIWAATGDETATLTRQSDIRKDWKYPVWDAEVTATWDDDDTGDVTQTITINGIINKLVFTTPDATNSVTYQCVILDNEGATIFDTGELAEADTYPLSLWEPVTGTISIVIGPSGALGATNPDATVVLRGI